MPSESAGSMIPLQQPMLGVEELEAVRGVFESRHLTVGAVTEQFERELAERLGARHVLAVNTGTSALHLALEALHPQPGSEVIVPSLTYVASIQAILAAGCTPVFCESNPQDLNLDTDHALSLIGPKTAALMPVHFGGVSCDMDPILEAAEKKGLAVIEDAAHAFGSTYRGRKIGTLGTATCFSFDAIKTITCGEGGAVATDDDRIARTIRLRRRLGIDPEAWDASEPWGYGVTDIGYRYHMPNLNAAIGLAQLSKWQQIANLRRSILHQYDQAFEPLSWLKIPDHRPDQTVPFTYVVRVLNDQRRNLMAHLKSLGVSSGVHYIPNHLHEAFKKFHRALPKTEAIYSQIVTIPFHANLTDSDVGRVIEAVRAFMPRGSEN